MQHALHWLTERALDDLVIEMQYSISKWDRTFDPY